jgi:hypothetical protein
MNTNWEKDLDKKPIMLKLYFPENGDFINFSNNGLPLPKIDDEYQSMI